MKNKIVDTSNDWVKYGVRIYKNQSSSTLQRLYNSIGFTYISERESQKPYSSFDDKPIYRDIKLCNINNGVVTAYAGDDSFTYGDRNRNIFVEIPKFYYQISDTVYYIDIVISNYSFDGFKVVPCFASCKLYPNGLNVIYVGDYEAWEWLKPSDKTMEKLSFGEKVDIALQLLALIMTADLDRLNW